MAFFYVYTLQKDTDKKILRMVLRINSFLLYDSLRSAVQDLQGTNRRLYSLPHLFNPRSPHEHHCN